MTSMTGSVTTSTLSVGGFVWCCQRVNGRIAFRRSPHAIIFHPWSGFYQITENGETVFVARSVTECLENATEIVLDYYATGIIPSWEAGSHS
jgi:hypothetical protein